MIAKSVQQFCCEPIENIKNYAEAVADTENVWFVHHVWERFWTAEELMARRRYYNRPADELVFVNRHNHFNWRHKGHERTEEWIAKISASNKGKKRKQPPWNKGKKGLQSAETRKKLSDAKKGKPTWNKGKKMNDEFRSKVSIGHLGQHAWNKGKTGGHWKLVDGKRIYY